MILRLIAIREQLRNEQKLLTTVVQKLNRGERKKRVEIDEGDSRRQIKNINALSNSFLS